MKIGYPCINTEIGCTPNSTFRIVNFSREKLVEKVENNLCCLENILRYNRKNKLLFFRISSDLVPFAGHTICNFNWKRHFRKKLAIIGGYIKESGMRISMHPDQFTLINSPRKDVVTRSISDLKWHCELLEAMGLDKKAKVQIHVGGVYGNKEGSVERFIENYQKLPLLIRERLVVENDERLYSLQDCIKISAIVGVPVLFDVFHHLCLNNGESTEKALKMACKTWEAKDGLPMVDYSSQEFFGRKGKHATTVNIEDFKNFIAKTKMIDFDLMLEIKDKEKSAKKALKIVRRIREI